MLIADKKDEGIFAALYSKLHNHQSLLRLLRKNLVILCTGFLIVVSSCGAPTQSKENTYSLTEKKLDKDSLSDLYIEQPVYDFGVIKTGTKISHAFKIINKSKIPLIIKTATTSCGCTVARIPGKPILYNQEDSIVAVFSSSMVPGIQNKVIRIVSNSTGDNKSVTIVGKTVQ